jgi:hypothetical protein
MYKTAFVYIFIALACSACDTDNNNTPIAISVPQPSQAEQGLKAFIDPATGELTSQPSANQAIQLEEANRSDLQIQLPLIGRTMSDGTTEIDLKQRFHTQLSATIDHNGELNIQHKSLDGE